MLNKSYPYYLANRPQTSRTLLVVRNKYSGRIATRVAVPDAKAVV
jgi:aldehyde dehydrogenase (NAD+)